MLCITFFEQPERRVFVAETRINSAKLIRIDVGARGQVPELLGDLQRISPPARDSINPTKSTSDELVFCRHSFILSWNLVVFGKSLRIHVLHCICPRHRCTY